MWFQEASTFVEGIDKAFNFTMAVSVFFLITITIFVIYCLVRFSYKRNPNPSNNDGNVVLEVLWTVIPTILVIIMFFYGYAAYSNYRNIPQGAMKVKVYAGKWYWKFKYANGIELSGKQGMKVPINKPVELELISNDVVHSFFVPAFRVKLDVMPTSEGRANNTMWFQATKKGEFEIFCAEYCGLDHAQMLSKVVVVNQQEFDGWYKGAGSAQAKKGKESPGKKLYQSKGCFACHTIDGKKGLGPSFKGLWGKKETVVTGGTERKQVVNAAYIEKSLKNPNADIVKGFQPIMPPQKLSKKEMQQMIDFIKSMK